MAKNTYQTPEEYELDLRKTLTSLTQNQSWDSRDMLGLKNIAQSIHTHITYLIGKKFLSDLNLPQDNFKYADMCKNGYDIELQDVNGKQIVAEIKGNLPLNGTTYGAEQKRGIIDNIKDLTIGKSKAMHKTEESLENVYRFLILLDNNENAINNLINNLCKRNKYNLDYFTIWRTDTPLNDGFLEKCKPNIINVVFISL